VIARDHKHIHWPDGSGIFLVDYDRRREIVAWPRATARPALHALAALRDGPHLWRPSASSCIINGETDEVLRGVCGQRMYAVVKDATDCRAPVRCWSTGCGSQARLDHDLEERVDAVGVPLSTQRCSNPNASISRADLNAFRRWCSACPSRLC